MDNYHFLKAPAVIFILFIQLSPGAYAQTAPSGIIGQHNCGFDMPVEDCFEIFNRNADAYKKYKEEKSKNLKDFVTSAVIIAGSVALACIDGCTVAASILATAGSATVAIPVYGDGSVFENIEPEDISEEDLYINLPDLEKPINSDDYKFTKVYPIAAAIDNWKNGIFTEPTFTIKHFKRLLPDDTYAFPVDEVHLRYPGENDRAGGVFESSRNESIPKEELERLGPTARRVHGGIDFKTTPKMSISSPLTGRVEYMKEMTGKNGLKLIVIKSDSGARARVLYVEPLYSLEVGDEVVAGKGSIGSAQDIRKEYGNNVPNHIHVDFFTPDGYRIDPYTGKVALPCNNKFKISPAGCNKK